jgi:hypothetical protein
MAMGRIARSLLLATALTGVYGAAEVQAEPVSTFLIGLGAGFAGTAGAGVYLGALGAGAAVGEFLAANIGSLVLGAVLVGVDVIANSQPQAQSSVNVKLAAGPRWHVAGRRKVGGSVLFFKFDAFKNFWYLIVHCDSELVEGAVGISEPGLTITGMWSRIYDHRDEDQDPDDMATWPSSSTNAALIWAWNQYRPRGFGRPMSQINWDKIDEAADICDLPITDKYSDVWPQWECSVAFPEDKVNGERHPEPQPGDPRRQGLRAQETAAHGARGHGWHPRPSVE